MSATRLARYLRSASGGSGTLLVSQREVREHDSSIHTSDISQPSKVPGRDTRKANLITRGFVVVASHDLGL